MEITINLYSDWLDLSIQEIETLKEKGFKFKDCTSQMDSIHTYLDFQHKLIMPKPRSVEYSNEFTCPLHLRNGFCSLERKIIYGDTLFPHLSRQISKASKQDGLLFDWGIHHLHLGVNQDKKYPYLAEGTEEILYVIFNRDTAYLLTIDTHNKFADIDLLRIVKKSFPFLIDKYKMKGIWPGETLTSERITKLRRAGVSPISEVDGDLYIPPGGGINRAGGSLTSIIKIQTILRCYKNAENIIKDEIVKFIESNSHDFTLNTTVITLKMRALEDSQITVVCEEHNIQVELMFNIDKSGFRKISIKKGEHNRISGGFSPPLSTP